MWHSDIFCFIFGMVFIRGSSSGSRVSGPDRLGLTDNWIREIIATEVAFVVRRSIPEMFGSIKTVVIELYDDHYATLSDVVVVATVVVSTAGIQGERYFQYWDFNYTKPPKFDKVEDPILAIRWLSNVEGCLFTCSCPA